MTTAHCARMAINSDEIIFERLAIVGAIDTITQVQIVQRENNLGVEFPPHTSEALQMNDQDVRSHPELELLARLAEVLAAGTVPSVVLTENLSLAELVETLVEGDAEGPFMVHLCAALNDLRIVRHLQVLLTIGS